MLQDTCFLPLNYEYIFESEDPHTRSLANSLVSSAEACGATFVDHFPTDMTDRKFYILTPTVERKFSTFSQVTLFWLVDRMNMVHGHEDASPLHIPRDPESPRWQFLSGHVATLSGYHGREQTLIQALLAAAGAMPELELDVERTTLLIAEQTIDMEPESE